MISGAAIFNSCSKQEATVNPVRLELFSLSGEMILQQQTCSATSILDLSGHPPGTYLLKISSAAGGQNVEDY